MAILPHLSLFSLFPHSQDVEQASGLVMGFTAHVHNDQGYAGFLRMII